jgi:hypothetical protein
MHSSSRMRSCTQHFFCFYMGSSGLLITRDTRRYTPANTVVAAFHFTLALLPAGPTLLTHPPVWYKPELVKTEKELEDAELKELIARPLRENKKAKKKAAAAAAPAEEGDKAE